MILPIVKEPNPILRQPCKLIEDIPNNLYNLSVLATNMGATARANDGVGLAAPQIGQSIQMFVTLVNDEFRVFLNPKIALGRKKVISTEECLSIPDFQNTIMRSKRVKIIFQTLKGDWNILDAKGLLARVLQHECDHLFGILISDK